jgi:hypothetical protein
MSEEKKPLTLEDLKKNKELLNTISQYTRDRYKRDYTNSDEASRRLPVRVSGYSEQYL